MYKNIALLIGSTIFALVAAELAAKMFVSYRKIPERELLMHWKASLYVPHPYLGYALRPSYKREPYKDGFLSINRLGYRGPEIVREKPPGTFRIVCLGGSTTFSIRVGNRTTYPRLLEERLRATYSNANIEVINAGVGAYTSAQSLINLNLRILDLDPDVLVIHHAVNDVHPRVSPNFKPDYSHYRKSFVFPEEGFSDYLARLSTLYAAFRYRFLRQSFNIWHLTVNRKLAGIPKSEQDENFNATTSATFRRNIQNMVAVAEDKGIEVVLSTLTFNEELFAENTHGASYETYVSGIKQHNDVIRSIADRNGLVLVDLAANFPSRARDLFSDWVHLSSTGTPLKAQLFHDEIVRSQVIEQIVARLAP